MMSGPTGDRAVNTVHVIVTCSNRKTRPVPDHLRLANVPGGTDVKRARNWIIRLGQQKSTRPVAASDLYAGEHWAIARSLPDLGGAHEKVHLWACSAGYGLTSATVPIHPYAATFATGHADSVTGDTSRWWRALGEWTGPDPAQPRTIRALAETDPGAVFMLMLSPPYMQACHDDIEAACEKVSCPDRFLLISAGVSRRRDLSPILVPSDARLQHCLGGTRQALNVRVGASLLAAGIRGHADASAHLSSLLQAQPPLVRYDRKKLNDDEVMSFIKDGLARFPRASASRLLRELRDEGYACEQGRFGQLHQKLIGARP
jgi:hypothetical protein